MRTYIPVRTAILIFDTARLIALAFFLDPLSSFEISTEGRFFPYIVYLTPNAIFALMALFLLLGIKDYINYLPLYLAGKILSIITFVIWDGIFFGNVIAEKFLVLKPGTYNFLFLCYFALNMGDLFTVFGSGFLLKKLRHGVS